MRLDKFLKVSRIIKRRTIAKMVVDEKKAKLDGKIAKAGTEVKVGPVSYTHLTLPTICSV